MNLVVNCLQADSEPVLMASLSDVPIMHSIHVQSFRDRIVRQ